jgi:hypothetical protein
MVLAAGVHERRKEQSEHRHVAQYENPDTFFAGHSPAWVGGRAGRARLPD